MKRKPKSKLPLKNNAFQPPKDVWISKPRKKPAPVIPSDLQCYLTVYSESQGVKRIVRVDGLSGVIRAMCHEALAKCGF